MKFELYCGNCLEVLKSDSIKDIIENKTPVIVTDPPFNVGYHYNKYHDRMKEDDYLDFIGEVLGSFDRFVLIHYPEQIYRVALHMGLVPERVVSWVYNSNTGRQHRDIAYFGFKPDFNLVRQPYKNLNDKRIQKRIAEGKTGAKIYDWWNVNQVKNVSKVKTCHPCQMPQEVMDNAVGIIPDKENTVVIDPFMGSCTTGLACVKYDLDFIGIDMDEEYYSLCEQRMKEAVMKK